MRQKIQSIDYVLNKFAVNTFYRDTINLYQILVSNSTENRGIPIIKGYVYQIIRK